MNHKIHYICFDFSSICKDVGQSKNILLSTIVPIFTSKETLGGAIILRLGHSMVGAFLYTNIPALSSAGYLSTYSGYKRLIGMKLFDSSETSNCVSLYNNSGGNVNTHDLRPNEEIINAVRMKTLILYTGLNTRKQSEFRASLIRLDSNSIPLGIESGYEMKLRLRL